MNIQESLRLSVIMVPLMTSQLAAQTAETVYTNGRIYTVNEDQPWAEAVAIRDSRFISVGSADDMKPLIADGTDVIDLGGRFVMPGLIDSHVHPISVAEDWAGLRITDPTDVESILAEVKAYADANPDLPMIRGGSWNLGVFENDSPRKDLLDAIDSQRPIYLMSQTGHSAWVNSKALEMAKITKDTPNGGKFVFDAEQETGEPTGTVREFAMGAVEQVLPITDLEAHAESTRRVMELFSSFGFTALKCAGGREHYMKAAAALDAQGKLDARLFPCWEWRSHYTSHNEKEQDELPYTWEKYASDRLYPRAVKMFYDGAPDSRTALLIDDYEGQPGFRGQSNLPKKEFLDVITRFNAGGIGVLVHVLGDGGAREVVDIFAQVRERNGDNGVPLHLSHAWMARPADIERLSTIRDAVIDFSPALNYPAPEIEGSMAPPIGEERYHGFFNVRSAIEAGIPVGFGSDWASSLIPDPNGFHQIQSWVTRRNPEAPSSPALNELQKVSLEQAVRGFTLGGAECIGFGWSEKIGSIEAGKLADFIVVNRNIFEIPIEELYQSKVLTTVVGGQVVFDRAKELAELDVVKVKVTSPELQNAIDVEALNLLVTEELAVSGRKCCGVTHQVDPGTDFAPAEVTVAFGRLMNEGYRYVRPARTVTWRDDNTYWIQWTVMNDTAVLWAYDTELQKAVEILQVREK